MHLAQNFTASAEAASLQRAKGTLRLSAKSRGTNSCLDGLHSAGCARAFFPRRTDSVEAIVVNTSGGLTGGDTFDIDACAGSNSNLIVTTQAAERAYRSTSGLARIRSRLSVAPGASLCWLPQELLIFDGAGLDRGLHVDLVDESAELVLVEPIVFGRTAMREVVQTATFLDRISIERAGLRLYEDRIALTGEIPARLARTATAGAMQAMACALYVGKRAEAVLEDVRSLLPATGGASLLSHDVLVIRLLAPDGFLLRKTLCPVLESLSGAPLPRSWRL